ncbi:hypothetical protein BBJ28_00017893 [Nothophytophthora sp. Chile5]|nr:hypothetical protein BBJ28_00017893 [Nothophytophthora sp. Chile5]
MIGVLLLTCGTISAVVNLDILRQSVTAPFAAMTLIFNGILACTVLHEPITKVDVLATILVLLGVCVAMVGVGMAEQQSAASALADIERLFLHSPFPAVCTGATVSALLAATWLIQRHYLQMSALGFCCFAMGAGVLSGFSSLCVKATVEITKGAVGSPPSDDLQNPVTYIFALGIVVCVLAQLKLMSLGLQHFGTLKFVPAYHAFIVLSNLMNGLVFFDEARNYDQRALAVFGFGCGLAIAGVLLLMAKVPRPQDELFVDVFELDDDFERPDFVENRGKDDTLATRDWT